MTSFMHNINKKIFCVLVLLFGLTQFSCGSSQVGAAAGIEPDQSTKSSDGSCDYSAGGGILTETCQPSSVSDGNDSVVDGTNPLSGFYYLSSSTGETVTSDGWVTFISESQTIRMFFDGQDKFFRCIESFISHTRISSGAGEYYEADSSDYCYYGEYTYEYQGTDLLVKLTSLRVSEGGGYEDSVVEQEFVLQSVDNVVESMINFSSPFGDILVKDAVYEKYDSSLKKILDLYAKNLDDLDIQYVAETNTLEPGKWAPQYDHFAGIYHTDELHNITYAKYIYDESYYTAFSSVLGDVEGDGLLNLKDDGSFFSCFMLKPKYADDLGNKFFGMKGVWDIDPEYGAEITLETEEITYVLDDEVSAGLEDDHFIQTVSFDAVVGFSYLKGAFLPGTESYFDQLYYDYDVTESDVVEESQIYQECLVALGEQISL